MNTIQIWRAYYTEPIYNIIITYYLKLPEYIKMYFHLSQCNIYWYEVVFKLIKFFVP
jgi:hypothetical protein